MGSGVGSDVGAGHVELPHTPPQLGGVPFVGVIDRVEQTKLGTVVSNKMQKTVVVAVESGS